MTIEITNSHETKVINAKAVRKLIFIIGSQESKIPCAYLSIVFMNNTDIRKINRKHLHHDYATDVLSFHWPEAKAIEGEIYISLDKAATQAKQFGVAYGDEILRLTAHGFLHILGYDDRTAAQRKRMLALGDRYISMIRNM